MARGGVVKGCAATRGSDDTTVDDTTSFATDSSETDQQVLALHSQFTDAI